jgi:transposase-like protein
MDSPKTLQQAIQHFGDFENCRKFMESVRWMDGIIRCPHCHSDRVTYLRKARVYKCAVNHPKQKFSLKTGTVFEDSPIPLEKWLPALWLMVSCKNGVSSYEIHRALGVTQKSAWFMLHRIRTAMKTGGFGDNYKLGGSDGGAVEVDETFIGGKAANMHKGRRLAIQQVRSNIRNSDSDGKYPGKTAVIGILDRELRQVRAKVVPNVKRQVLQAEILREVKHGSKVYTDEHTGYAGLAHKYVHDTVNHLEQYVNGQVHTNGVENFWSLLKRTLKGTYVAVEPYHLDRYVDEQVFRFNNRATKDNPLNDSDRFILALSQIVGKRLTYAEATGKVGETSF